MRKKKKEVQVKERRPEREPIQRKTLKEKEKKGNEKRKSRVEPEKIAAKVNGSLAKTDAILV